MNIKDFLWIFPFLSFLLGYQFLDFVYPSKEIATPALVGQNLQTAIKILSDHNLNPRILTEKEEPDLQEGMVLSQTPQAGRKVKSNQSIYLVIARKPQKLTAPNLLNKTEQTIDAQLAHLGIRNKKYYLTSNHPEGLCLAQHPEPGTILNVNKMTTYISSGNNKPFLLPNVKGKRVKEVMEFFKKYNIKVNLFHTYSVTDDHVCHSCIIIDQKPLAGSLVHLNKAISVQLQIK